MLNTDLKFTTAGTMLSFEEQMDYHNTYGKTWGANTVWSIYDEDGYGEIKFGNELPKELVDGIGFLEYNGSWFNDEGDFDYSMKDVLKAKTWGDLWAQIDEMIMGSGDHHHIYIEAITRDPKRSNILQIHTGS